MPPPPQQQYSAAYKRQVILYAESENTENNVAAERKCDVPEKFSEGMEKTKKQDLCMRYYTPFLSRTEDGMTPCR